MNSLGVNKHYYTNLYRGRQKVLTESVFATAAERKSRLIVTLTEVVFLPASVSEKNKKKARQAHHEPAASSGGGLDIGSGITIGIDGGSGSVSGLGSGSYSGSGSRVGLWLGVLVRVKLKVEHRVSTGAVRTAQFDTILNEPSVIIIQMRVNT